MIEKYIAVFFHCSYKASGDFLFHGPSFIVRALGPWPPFLRGHFSNLLVWSITRYMWSALQPSDFLSYLLCSWHARPLAIPGPDWSSVCFFNLLFYPIIYFEHHLKLIHFWASLVVHWLRLQAPNAGGLGLIPGQGTRSHVPQLRPSTAR